MYNNVQRKANIISKKTGLELPKKVINYVNPKTKGQADYIRTINENDITLCHGLSGTGKTHIAVSLACQHFMEKRIDKILVSRPIVAVSVKTLGSLPGDVREKIDPYLIPIMEEMIKYFGSKETVERYIRDRVIEFAPLELLRGRTFDYTFMILDEAQNCSYEQLKMFLTRIGERSRIVVNGDTDQTDLKTCDAGGFTKCLDALRGVEGNRTF